MTDVKQQTGITVYKTVTGLEVKLSPGIVRQYLVNGDGKVTDQEVVMFIGLCKYNNLNPFQREAYCIKYGNSPATMVVSKDAYMKRAVRAPDYNGYEIEETDAADGAPSKVRCRVYRKGLDRPAADVPVRYEEYVGRTKDGSATKMWREKGHTMLRKVAIVQAMREAFPEQLGGMYSEEEMPLSQEHAHELPRGAVDATYTEVEQKPSLLDAAGVAAPEEKASKPSGLNRVTLPPPEKKKAYAAPTSFDDERVISDASNMIGVADMETYLDHIGAPRTGSNQWAPHEKHAVAVVLQNVLMIGRPLKMNELDEQKLVYERALVGE